MMRRCLGFVVFFVVILLIQSSDPTSTDIDDKIKSDLPIIPSDFEQLRTQAYQNHIYNDKVENRMIPRNFWISFREIPPEDKLSPHHVRMINDAKKNNWTVNIMDNQRKDEFMKKYYHDTSILWAYELINPLCRFASTDIWRYASLYAFGGFYIDDDSDIGTTSLEEIIKPEDTIILSREGIHFRECYNNEYHLSALYHAKKMGLMHGMDFVAQSRLESSIVQFAFFVAPKHSFFKNLLTNIVDLVKREYMNQSPIMKSLHQHQRLMCLTGPFLFAAVLREYMNIDGENDSDGISPEEIVRIDGKNFEGFGGKYHVDGYIPYSKQNITYEGSLDTMSHGDILPLSRYHSSVGASVTSNGNTRHDRKLNHQP